MLKQVQAIYEANRTLSNEEIAKELRAVTGLRLSECREWVKAWVLA
jgi:hypothetical protein